MKAGVSSTENSHTNEFSSLMCATKFRTSFTIFTGEEVLIESGRATADPKNGTIRLNFINRPATKLMPATWFTREEKNSKEFVLQPLPEKDSWQVEMLYQNAVRASSSLGEGIDGVLKEEVILESEPQYKVCVSRNGGLLSMKKRLKKSNFFSLGEVQYTLQRGYGQYTIEGKKSQAEPYLFHNKS